MEKICQYCKYYHNGKCLNGQIQQNMIPYVENSADEVFEEGYVDEYLREHLETNTMIDIIVDSLRDSDYIKKNKKMISYNKLQDYDSFENELVEMCSDVLSHLILPKIKDINTEIEMEVKPDFGCIYWE